jgi:hypothetical protein
MRPTDPHGTTIRAFDALANDFIRDAAARFDAGAGLAQLDVERLSALAERLAGDLRDWSRAIETLDVAMEVTLSPGRSGRLLIETVFDEALTPPASRLLAISLDLAMGVL